MIGKTIYAKEIIWRKRKAAARGVACWSSHWTFIEIQCFAHDYPKFTYKELLYFLCDVNPWPHREIGDSKAEVLRVLKACCIFGWADCNVFDAIC